MSLVFVPFYLHFMGIEAFGLIALFATLQALFGIAQVGLTNTLNREMARLAVRENTSRDMRDLVRTLEILFWGIAGLISLVIVSLSQFIAYHWVNAHNLPQDSVRNAIIIMGLAAGFQWPQGFYSGGLNGLQRQVLLNWINGIMATLRGAGATLVLWLISPSINAFFMWQIVISVVHTGVVRYFLARSLPMSTEKAHFRRDLLFQTWQYAAGVSGITVLSTVLAQMDKVILSKLLSLEVFGYYGLASLIAINLNRLVSPACWAVFPRFTNLLEIGANSELGELYHKGAQIVSVLTLPVATIVIFYSREILLFWTHNPVSAEHSYLLASLLMIGAAIKSMMDIPYTLQLAAGWTKLTILINSVFVLVYVPLVVAAVRWKSAVGAAGVIPIMNLSCLLIYVHMMHNRLLPEAKSEWYRKDIGAPLVAAVAIAGISKLTIPIATNPPWGIMSLGLISSMTVVGAGFATAVTRNWMIREFTSLKVRFLVRS
jgi:O-antigen/teichoic acid export membrane protein